MKNIYLRYLATTKPAHGPGNGLTAVDQTTRRLLEVIALSYAQNRPLTVSAAMALAPVASPHTLHRTPQLNLLRNLARWIRPSSW